jgi:hypothetical protein
MHVINYLCGDGMGEHGDILQGADDKEDIHMRLITSLGAKHKITFYAKHQ